MILSNISWFILVKRINLLLKIRSCFVMVAIVIWLVPLTNTLVYVTLKLPPECVISTSDILERNSFCGCGNSIWLTSTTVAVHNHRSSCIWSVVETTIQLSMPFTSVCISAHTALDSHQKQAHRQHETPNVQELLITVWHDRRHDQQEANRNTHKIKYLKSVKFI